MSEWPNGPRDWSPRLAQAMREVAKLRPLIPAELIAEKLGFWNTGTVIPLRYNGEDLLSMIDLLVKVPFLNTDISKLRPTYNGAVQEIGIVHIYSDGFVHVDLEIYYLLTGQIKGYEHLAGRWPWEDCWGPPDPREKAAPEQVMGMELPTNSLGEYF